MKWKHNFREFSLRSMNCNKLHELSYGHCGGMFALTHSQCSHTSTHLLRSYLREPQGGEKGSAEHQNKVRQLLVIHSKTHQATSGIIRGLSLMCESRKERSDGIAIATKSIASSSPLREQMRGNTWGRGGYTLNMFALTMTNTIHLKNSENWSLFFIYPWKNIVFCVFLRISLKKGIFPFTP